MQATQYTIKFGQGKVEGKTVFYLMQIYQKNTGKSYSFTTRFSQLLDIHKQCEAHCAKGQLPDFPAKKIFGNTNPDFIVKRKKQLENYYNTLLKTTQLAKLPALRKFIEKRKPQQALVPKPVDQTINISKGQNENKIPPEVSQKKKFEQICEQTISKLIDISNDYFVPPDESTAKRKKTEFEKIKFELKSPLFNQMKYPKGKTENFHDFWATDYFDEKKQFVEETVNKLGKISLDEVLTQASEVEIVHKFK